LFLVVLGPSLGFAQATLTGSPITGDIRPISFLSEATEANVLFANLAVGAAVDDNNNNSVMHPIGGAQYFADPSIAIEARHGHWAGELSYQPTLRVYVPSSSHIDLFNQAMGGTFHYEITKRLAIGLRQDYLRTFDPFQQLADTPLQPGIGLGNRPGAVFLPDFRRTELLSQAEIDYRMAKYTSVGISSNFKQIQGNELGRQHKSLLDTNDTLGSAFVSHQFTARQAVGVQYEFLDIVFPGKDTRTRTHGIFIFHQIAIREHLKFSAFAGPEYSRIHNQILLNLFGVIVPIPVSSTLWSAAGGAILDERTDRVGLQASFVRRISDGGGLLGAVEMNDAALNVRAKMAHRWVANFDGEMAQHTLLNEPAIGKLQLLNVGAGVAYELDHELWIRALYQRAHELGESHSTLASANHNRMTLSVERNFTLPIGR
jgi:hypothetical protein